MTFESSELEICEAPAGTVDQLISRIRSRLDQHLNELQLGGVVNSSDIKHSIRNFHSLQRQDLRIREATFLTSHGHRLVSDNFACGSEIVPSKIKPYIVRVESSTDDARLFRLATLLWSVPVSKGFGRRMRYLIRDRSNGKLIGIFGLTDPVFNLNSRDQLIGWNADDRRARLVNVMDAHVVGAVPPYSQILGGKLVASLMTSKEVCTHFADKYRDRSGVISGVVKQPKLALITVTSALGRSSIYNRLKIPGLVEFQRIGVTKGWGHFHVPDDLFADMRELLKAIGHPYANGHKFGDGPNWRMRVVRVVFKVMELDQNILRHGIEREVYVAPIAQNWRAYLTGYEAKAEIKRPSVTTISKHAIQRWILPRAERCPDYLSWKIDDTWNLLRPLVNEAETVPEQSLLI